MRLRHSLALVAVTASLLVPTPQAEATAVGAIVFQGTMTTAPGFLLPCFPTIGDCPGTAPVSVVTISGTDFLVPMGGAAGAFSMSTSVCIGGAGFAKGGTVGTAGALCALIATGTVAGHCGLSHGAGVLTAVVGSILGVYAITVGFQWFDVGGARLLVSDPIPTMGSALVGTMSAVPVPVVTPVVANTCVTGAFEFHFEGSLAFVDVT